MTDLAQAFRVLRIDISDLNEFLEEVESSPLDHQIPRFPIPRNSSHVYHGPTSYGETSKRRSRAPSLSSEDEEFDHIPPYLPPLPSQIDADKGEGYVALEDSLYTDVLISGCWNRLYTEVSSF